MNKHHSITGAAWTTLLSLFVCTGAAQAVNEVYVDWMAPNGGDGESWATAYNDLSDALDAASSGDDLWVTAGVYSPDGPGGSRNRTFSVGDGVRVFGGFAGDELNRNERDWTANVTILSGDLNVDDGPDFENTDDNSYHVVIVLGSGGNTRIDGFTIAGGHADGVTNDGAGLFAGHNTLQVRHCTFVMNQAQSGGGIWAEAATLDLFDCTFRDNRVSGHGAAVRVWESSTATITDCSFEDNFAGVGGAIATDGLASLEVVGSSFIGNRTVAGGAGAFIFDTGETRVTGCTFQDNDAGFGIGAGGGLILGGGVSTVRDCLFGANFAGDKGAAIASNSVTTMINCVLSRGTGAIGGGVYTSADLTMINCTVSQNDGSGVVGDAGAHITFQNSILWNNIPNQVTLHPQGGSAVFAAYFCDVAGGWPHAGSNNIDADPLFVQPGADNVRLSVGSPCLNAGDNSAVPPDVETDLDGNPRIQDGVVDMGAYEGAYVALPASAVATDLDPGDVEFLVPNGIGFHPEDYDTVITRNYTGADDAMVSVTEMPGDGLTAGGGFSVLGTPLEIETTMSDGEFINIMFIVFDEEDLGGADPLDLDITYFDEATGNWALAVSANTVNSPGHERPIGDRVAVEGPGDWGLAGDLGDWGVYWNPEAGRGFVWAHVDHAAVFSFGVPLCAADVVQPPDDRVDMSDLLDLLWAWGFGPGPEDIDDDGTVDVLDLLLLLDAWGGCP